MDIWANQATGFARFNNTQTLRYRLARSLTGEALAMDIQRQTFVGTRVTFVMLNPSTADAFKLDPTVTRCMKWATEWGASVGEVVNLYAIRSTDPRGVWTAQDRGDDEANDQAILQAARGAAVVVAAWGNHPKAEGRARQVARMLLRERIQLHSLALTNCGAPRHPLYVSFREVPQRWP